HLSVGCKWDGASVDTDDTSKDHDDNSDKGPTPEPSTPRSDAAAPTPTSSSPDPSTDDIVTDDPGDHITVPDPVDGGEPNCGGEEVKAAPREVHLVVALDRSDSMAINWEDGVERMTVMKSALLEALDAVSDKMSIGLELFPNGDEDCRVEGD